MCLNRYHAHRLPAIGQPLGYRFEREFSVSRFRRRPFVRTSFYFWRWRCLAVFGKPVLMARAVVGFCLRYPTLVTSLAHVSLEPEDPLSFTKRYTESNHRGATFSLRGCPRTAFRFARLVRLVGITNLFPVDSIPQEFPAAAPRLGLANVCI